MKDEEQPRLDRLLLLGHSEKDGPGGTLGTRGIELARSVGGSINGFRFTRLAGAPEGDMPDISLHCKFARVFYGPQVPVIQTAFSFCTGGLPRIPLPMPIVYGFGDEAMMAEIWTSKLQAAVASGLSTNYEAILQVHGAELAMTWGESCRMVLDEMFDAMRDRPSWVGLGVFNRIPIELAALACGARPSEKHLWTGLGLVEGILFYRNEEGVIAPAYRASIPKNAENTSHQIEVDGGGSVIIQDRP